MDEQQWAVELERLRARADPYGMCRLLWSNTQVAQLGIGSSGLVGMVNLIGARRRPRATDTREQPDVLLANHRHRAVAPRTGGRRFQPLRGAVVDRPGGGTRR
jgi:hypothetical protein